MKKFNPPLRRILERAQRRFVRSRPGSVLILVVALLLLMAIIGTAYMSMAQSDRITANTHANVTEIDMLLEGVVSMVKGSVNGELFAAGGKFRDAHTASTVNAYNNWNGVGLQSFKLVPLANQNVGSPFIADRFPDVLDRTVPPTILRPSGPTNAPGANEPFWAHITAPLAGTEFSSPYWRQTENVFLEGQVPLATPPGDPYHYTQRDSVRPQVTIANKLIPGFTQIGGSGPFYPAWVAPGGADSAILAADTDGDGVADAGYFKLPVGTINGVTYYAAVRIIDNAAAINVNTATWPNATPAVSGTIFPGDFFPTSINLRRFIYNAPYTAGPTPDSFPNFLGYRQNNVAPAPSPSMTLIPRLVLVTFARTSITSPTPAHT